MAQVSIEVDPRALKGFLRSLEDGSGQLVRITTEVMSRAVKVGEVYAKENLTRKILNPRTGHLRASVKGEVIIGDSAEDGSGTITGRIGILKPKSGKEPLYGAAQEFGADAKPVNAKVMTIPLKAALTAAGVTRFTANEARQIYDRTFWWRDILYGVMSEKGRGKRKRTSFSGQVPRLRGLRRDKIIPLFWGATFVKIGGGKGVGRGYLQDARNRIVGPMNKALAVKVADLLQLRKAHAE